MERLPLDVQTADRLLSGNVLPEDAPPGYGPVASLIAAASAEPEEIGTREQPTLAILVAAVRSSRVEEKPSPRRSYVHRFKLAAALVTAGLACTTGLALADGLPGAAQDIASTMLATAGITVPGPDDHAGTHPSIRGSSQTVREESPTSGAPNAGTSGKGAEISQLATTTDLSGVEKGAAISSLASGGKSRAGQHGQALEEHGQASEPKGSAEPSTGVDNPTADTASQGRSTAGSDNAITGQSHRP